MTDCLEIIPSGLLVADVSVQRGVSGSSSQVLAFSEGDMLTFGVLVALCETKVNDVYVVLGVLVAANQEVVWLDIAMDDPLLVHFLNSLNL